MGSSPASAIAIAAAALGLVLYYYNRPSTKVTRLRGPPRNNLFLGYARELFRMDESDPLCDEWEKQYGPAFEVPSLFGTYEVVLADPKAVLHYFSLQTTTYRHTAVTREFFENFFGQNLLSAEGDDHKRQRKALSPAFSNAEIRKLTPIFYDCAYTLKTAWDSMLQDCGQVTMDVQEWINYVSLDCIGISVFGHDFGSLKGTKPPIFEPLETLLDTQLSFTVLLINGLIPFFPTPAKTHTALKILQERIKDVSHKSLERAKKERELEDGQSTKDKSILGTLIASENKSSMSHKEILGQHLMITAGYEPTAIALTWAVIELAKNPHVQDELREELSRFSSHDPNYEELMNSLPYLDAVTCETIRLHPPGGQVFREAYEDDVVPLSEPIIDAYGNAIDRIYIPKGTIVRIPTATVGTSERLWGSNGREFLPDRWLNNSVSASRANEIQGYRHLLAFSDGPRTCPGKGFALVEFKAILSVLVRNYSFELPEGPDSQFKGHISLLERPTTVGRKEFDRRYVIECRNQDRGYWVFEERLNGPQSRSESTVNWSTQDDISKE